jgi:dTDP-4-dehydrorhamnose 3,5-epimerase
MIDGVIFTPLPIINTVGGDVLHGMKESDEGFHRFGEAYFSTIKSGAIKGWKLHQEMVLNLVVPEGSVGFVIFDDRDSSKTAGEFSEILLSRKIYGRLTVPPKLWVGFKGVSEKDSLLLNIANIPHDKNEVEHRALDEIDYDWSRVNLGQFNLGQ